MADRRIGLCRVRGSTGSWPGTCEDAKAEETGGVRTSVLSLTQLGDGGRRVEDNLARKGNQYTVKTITIGKKVFKCIFADLLPLLRDEERLALVADIRVRGIIVPIVVDEDGNVIDGFHRLSIAQALSLPLAEVPFRVVKGLSLAEKQALAEALNTHRRHLSQAQKRELVIRKLQADPQRSDRDVAAEVAVSDKTVASVRQALESTAEIPQSATRKGKDGKIRRQRSQAAPTPAPAPAALTPTPAPTPAAPPTLAAATTTTEAAPSPATDLCGRPLEVECPVRPPKAPLKQWPELWHFCARMTHSSDLDTIRLCCRKPPNSSAGSPTTSCRRSP
jgi:hypothetical protein